MFNIQGGYYGNALQAASKKATSILSRASWRRGADINARGGEYGTALQAASARGHLDIVQILLEKGADINANGGLYGNALQAASDRGYLDIRQGSFSRRCIDINAKGRDATAMPSRPLRREAASTLSRYYLRRGKREDENKKVDKEDIEESEE